MLSDRVSNPGPLTYESGVLPIGLRGPAGWGGGVVDGWTDEQAQTNLPLQLLRSWGHNNALMYKICSVQAQFMTILFLFILHV